MEKDDVPRGKAKWSLKLVAYLILPLLFSFLRVEPSFFVSLMSVYQAIVLRFFALQGKRVYVLEDRYLWILPLTACGAFLLLGAIWHYHLAVAFSYAGTYLLSRKYRLPFYLLMIGIAFQALNPPIKTSFYTIVLPSVYGMVMMIGGLGLLERKKKE